jgi:3-deoxy-manno-octulosonate cytidylyltransferase (CMP-KDO synthetase)
MKTLGIIPARYASTRFSGKPLVFIQGKTMIQRVYEQAMQANSLQKVVVATDDLRIFEAVKKFGGEVVMTAPTHQSGTDRCAEVLQTYPDFDFVVNIQGDEPFIQPEQINKTVAILHQKKVNIATLAKKITENTLLHNPNVVKVVFDKKYKALYFSRHAIPFVRGAEEKDWLVQQDFYKHIGLYAFRAKTLRQLAKLSPSNLEQSESLEQLRWLENGFRIGVALTDLETIGIDTPEDLEKIGDSH